MKVFSENINGVDVVAQINGVDVEGSDWSLTTKFMAEDRMTLTASIPVDQDSDTKIKFGKDWYVKDEYGNIYTLVSAQPTSSKKSKSLETTYSLVFGGADIYLSKRTYREKATLGENQLSYSSTVAFIGNIDDFLDRLELNLDTAFGKTVQIMPKLYQCKYRIKRSYGDISFSQSDYKSVSFSNLSIWEVLLKTNEIYGYEWLSYTDTNTGQIVFEFNTTVGDTLDHTFTYRGDRNYDLSTKESLDSIQGGITDLTVTDKMSEVKTRITGTGGTTNIPLNHYILSDYNFLRDYEVAERPTYLRNLMPRVYRCYVMGFNDQRYYLAKDVDSDDVINDNEAYPKVMDLENRFSYHDAADDIASGDITIDTFEAWHLNYKNVWNKPNSTDAAQYSRLNLDDDWYALDDKDTPDWDDLTTPPYGFKAYLKGWKDRAKGGDLPEVNFDPVSYVDSIHQADYGIIEQVNEADESIYPALGDDVNDIIDAEEVEADGKAVVIPSGAFPVSITKVTKAGMFSRLETPIPETAGLPDSINDICEQFVTSKYSYLNNIGESVLPIMFSPLSITANSAFSMSKISQSIDLMSNIEYPIPSYGATANIVMTIKRTMIGANINVVILKKQDSTITTTEVYSDEGVFGNEFVVEEETAVSIPISLEYGYTYIAEFNITPVGYGLSPMVSGTVYYDAEYEVVGSGELQVSMPQYQQSIDFNDEVTSLKPSFEILIDGYISLVEDSDIDTQTFDIWIKDIGFNIAEINKNEASITISFDSYYELYEDVYNDVTDPPDGISKDDYLLQIQQYLEVLSGYLSDVGSAYGWEKIKEGVESDMIPPLAPMDKSAYLRYIIDKIAQINDDYVPTGNSGTGNLYKYFGTQNPVIKFTTGDIAGEYEYELAIIGGQPQVFEDTSRSNNGVQSKYRLTLMRNSDDYDATGLLLPGGTRQAKAGDRFELSKIELPFSWLYDGENRQEEYMRSQLAEIDTHQPDVAIELDDIFLTEVLGDSRHKDYGKFKAGATIKVKSPLIDVYDADGVKSDEYEVRINSYTKTSKETKVSQS